MCPTCLAGLPKPPAAGEMTTPRPMNTSSGPPRGRGPALRRGSGQAWERPGARPATPEGLRSVSVGGTIAACSFAARRAGGRMRDAQQAIHQEHVSFHCDGHTLSGYLYKPAGRGPFPAVVWNHGIEQDPNVAKQFGTIADILNGAGFVLFAPLRRGHGDSQGPYLVDQVKHERQLHGDEAADRLMVRLMEGPQLDDQLAGLKYLRTLPYVNLHRLGVMGASHGPRQSLL